MTTNTLDNILINLNILKSDINKKVFDNINQLNNNDEYIYLDFINKNTLNINTEYGNTKEGFDTIFKKSLKAKTLSDMEIVVLHRYENGLLFKIPENQNKKTKIIEVLINEYINNIFYLLGLNKNKKIDFDNFIHTFVLVSTKYSNFYDNALFDLDSLIKDKKKIKFILDTFK